MVGNLIKAGLLFAAYKYGNSQVKAMSLGVAGVLVAGYIPYLNGKNLKGEAV